MSHDPRQPSLFDWAEEEGILFSKNEWEEHWEGMPEYDNKEVKPYKSIKVNFATEEDYKIFAGMVQQNLTEKTKSISFPKKPVRPNANKFYVDGE